MQSQICSAKNFLFNNNGDGSFTAAQSFAVGNEPGDVAVADLNGDGRPDIVTTNFKDDTVSVLLNTAAPPATGTFSQIATVASSAGGSAVEPSTVKQLTFGGKASAVIPPGAPLMSDPLPYGMKANRASIEALVTYAVQQKLIPKRPALDEVFADPEAM